MIKRKLSHFVRGRGKQRSRERTELRSIVSPVDTIWFSNKFIFNMLPCGTHPLLYFSAPKTLLFFIFVQRIFMGILFQQQQQQQHGEETQTDSAAFLFHWIEFEFDGVFRFRRNLSCLQTTIHGKNYGSHYAKILEKLPNIYSDIYTIYVYIYISCRMWQYIWPANWVHNKFRVSNRVESHLESRSRVSFVVYFLTRFSSSFGKTSNDNGAKRKNRQEKRQQKRIFMTLENDLLYVLDSAYLPGPLALYFPSLSLSLPIRS